MDMAEKFGLEILCRAAREHKSSCIPAKAGAREGILHLSTKGNGTKTTSQTNITIKRG